VGKSPLGGSKARPNPEPYALCSIAIVCTKTRRRQLLQCSFLFGLCYLMCSKSLQLYC